MTDKSPAELERVRALEIRGLALAADCVAAMPADVVNQMFPPPPAGYVPDPETARAEAANLRLLAKMESDPFYLSRCLSD